MHMHWERRLLAETDTVAHMSNRFPESRPLVLNWQLSLTLSEREIGVIMILLFKIIITGLIQGWQVDFIFHANSTQWSAASKRATHEEFQGVARVSEIVLSSVSCGYQKYPGRWYTQVRYLVSLTYVISRTQLSKSTCTHLGYNHTQWPATHFFLFKCPFHSPCTWLLLLNWESRFQVNQKVRGVR